MMLFILLQAIKKKQIGMLKPEAILEKMNPNYANIYALSIRHRQINGIDDLNDLCLDGFASSYKSKNLQI